MRGKHLNILLQIYLKITYSEDGSLGIQMETRSGNDQAAISGIPRTVAVWLWAVILFEQHGEPGGRKIRAVLGRVAGTQLVSHSWHTQDSGGPGSGWLRP